MAYDSQSGRVILFGGEGYAALNDTWAYDFNTNTWTNMDPATKPAAQFGHSMVYDSAADRVILFAGQDPIAGFVGRTWAYDFEANAWTDLNPATSPPGRVYYSVAYDAQSDRVVLFGGWNGQSPVINDTWAYDFVANAWTNMNPVPAPSVRYSSSMAYDRLSDRVMLFGGDGYVGGLRNDTWAYDFNTNTWTNTAPTVQPPPRYGHALAYDAESDRVMLFGGEGVGGALADTWAYDSAANVWTSAYAAPRPVRRYDHAMAYDSPSDRVILFGGTGAVLFNDTWSYDFNTNTWTSMDPVTSPPARFGHAMAYDSGSDRVILSTGYFNGNFLDDTWSYDFNRNAWTNQDPLPKPLARYCNAMAYDSESDRVVLFGGNNLGGLHNDTWAYDFKSNAWTDMSTAVAPPARECNAMAYDSQSDRVILFGGYAAGIGPLNDTWSYDFNANTWTNMTPAKEPSARYIHAMAYDSGSDRVILFGGCCDIAGYFNDTWAYDFNTNKWTNMSATMQPSARHDHSMAYDSESDRVILFGGQDRVGTILNDTWSYDLNTNSWTNTAAGPSPRYGHAMAYDSQSDRVVLFGGYGVGYRNDSWAYDLNGNKWTNMDQPATLSAPQALTAKSSNAQVNLTWQAPTSNGTSPITGYNVYRGLVSGSLTLLSAVGDVRVYQDGGLTNGVTYYYQVTAVNGAGEGPRSGEVTAIPRTRPSAARNLIATALAARVVLTWGSPVTDGGAPVTAYAVYRGTAPGGSTLLATVGVVLTYTDDAVINGVTYYYQAAALNIVGEGSRSNEASAKPMASPDSIPPTATIVSLPNNTIVNSTTITLTGTASDNVAIQKVEVSTDGTTWILATGTTSWSANLTLTAGTNTIFVRTTDTSGNVAITTITVIVEQPALTPQGAPALAPERLVAGAVVGTAVAVGFAVSTSSAATSTSAASGSMTGKGLWLPWKPVMRFLRRRKRGAAQLQIDDRLYHPSPRQPERPNALFAESKGVLKPSKVLADVAPTLGLKARGPWLFGRYSGLPVVAKESTVSDLFEVLFQVALTPESWKGVRAALSDKGRVKSLGLQPAGLRVESSVSELVYDHRPLVRTKPADVVEILKGLAALAATGGPALGDRCEKCRQNPAGDVIVVNGLPTQLCPSDFEEIRKQGENASVVGKGQVASHARGIGLGLVGMFVGAGIWAAIGIVTGYVLSLAAFGISVLIANLIARGDVRVTKSLVALMILLTMLAIFLGDVIWVGVVIARLRGPLELLQAVEAYVKIVRSDPYVLVSYASGFLGILGSIAAMRRRARRARASFEVIS